MNARVFNNPEVVAQSWYVAARSRDVGRGRVATAEVCGRRVALYRDADGEVRAADAYCPHLGAWFGQGRVVDGQLVCAFHGWRFGPDGACVAAPGCASVPRRSVRTFPVVERWGLVWVFAGPRAFYDLPESAFGAHAAVVRLPRQRIACHPHLVIANGLDAAHYETLHGMDFTATPEVRDAGPCALALELRGRARVRLQRLLTGTARRDVSATFTTYGCSVAVARVTSPIDVEVLFTGMPDSAGGCTTQTIVLLPSWSPVRIVRAGLLFAMLLGDDRAVLDTIRFRDAFGERDVALAAFRDLVEALPTWCEATR
jgi:phenylpropionate dioxygenase-like ring-hydroxylating dioxygenase large terminal subunit